MSEFEISSGDHAASPDGSSSFVHDADVGAILPEDHPRRPGAEDGDAEWGTIPPTRRPRRTDRRYAGDGSAPTAEGPNWSSSADAGWGPVPPEDRVRWSQTLFEFSPRFPGVMVMNMTYNSAEGLDVTVPRLWHQIAREMHAVGFKPIEYYLLCQDIHLRIERDELDFWAHGRFFDRAKGWRPGGTPIPVAHLWASWPTYFRSGKSPHRATDYVLHEGKPPGIGLPESVTEIPGPTRRR